MALTLALAICALPFLMLQWGFAGADIRDWLTSQASGWDKTSGLQPPALPAEIIEKTRARYIEAYERLTGRTFTA